MTETDFTPKNSLLSGQRNAILEFLKQHKEADTVTLRETLGINHPAGRVCELRKAGWPIETHRGWAYDAQSRKHSTAVYALRGGAR